MSDNPNERTKNLHLNKELKVSLLVQHEITNKSENR